MVYVASGGHRGNAGRPLDPNSFASAKRGGADGFLVLSAASGEVPDFPLDEATSRELFWWDRMWSKPQGSEWLRLGLEDEVALYVRYLVEAEQPDAPSSVRTLVKQHQELLGLSTAGLNRLRWKMPDAEPVATSAAPTVKRRSSSRTRLKVVGNDG